MILPGFALLYGKLHFILENKLTILLLTKWSSQFDIHSWNKTLNILYNLDTKGCILHNIKSFLTSSR